jgi:hypothetical protein
MGEFVLIAAQQQYDLELTVIKAIKLENSLLIQTDSRREPPFTAISS